MTSEVHNIDCLEYMRTLPDNYFQLAIADPPYGIGARLVDGGGTNGMIKYQEQYHSKEWDEHIPGQEFFDELERISVNRIIWGGNYFPLPPTRCVLCWDKKVYVPTMSRCEFAWTSFDKPAKIVETPSYDPQRIHLTQKPVALYAWLLQNYAKDGDRIFDPMMGSQSSRIAAYKLGFDYVGCELDKEYFDKGCERFDRECHGIYVNADGSKVQQQTLF